MIKTFLNKKMYPLATRKLVPGLNNDLVLGSGSVAYSNLNGVPCLFSPRLQKNCP